MGTLCPFTKFKSDVPLGVNKRKKHEAFYSESDDRDFEPGYADHGIGVHLLLLPSLCGVPWGGGAENQ